jgi:hypothetical protein
MHDPDGVLPYRRLTKGGKVVLALKVARRSSHRLDIQGPGNVLSVAL